MLFNANSNTFNLVIDTIFKQNKQYQYIYVSVGSKYNERDVIFPSNTLPVSSRATSNALYQMVPKFLQDKATETNILVITIDLFRDSANLDYNRAIVTSVMKPNMDCCLVSLDCCSKQFIPLCISIMTNVRHQNTLPTCFMMCNYVKFMNMPNDIEHNAEKKVVQSIISVLHDDRFATYNDCFYQWYGYKYYLYNCIYKHSVSYHDLYFYNKISLLNVRMRDLSRPIWDHCPADSKFEKLLDHSYDVTRSYDIDPEICMSISMKHLFGFD